MQPMFDISQFLDPVGRYRSRGLFKEVCRPEDTPLFSWSKDTNNGYVNIRELFINLTVDDPSEATFAETLCGDIGWWEFCKESTWIKEPLRQWRQVAAIKRKSKAFQSIVKEVHEGGRSAFTAAKYLIEEPWVDKRTKSAKEFSQKTTSEAYDNVSADVLRLKASGFLSE